MVWETLDWQIVDKLTDRELNYLKYELSCAQFPEFKIDMAIGVNQPGWYKAQEVIGKQSIVLTPDYKEQVFEAEEIIADEAFNELEEAMVKLTVEEKRKQKKALKKAQRMLDNRDKILESKRDYWHANKDRINAANRQKYKERKIASVIALLSTK